MRRKGLIFALGLAALFAPAASGLAQDPVPLYPENYKVLFENDQVRVVDFRLAKGATEKLHSHPRHVAVFLSDLRIQFTLPDGTKKLRQAKAGEVAYSEPTSHASENIGGTDAHGILVELKGQAAPVPAGQISAVTLIHGLPGKEDDLKRHLLSLAAPTRAEPGCLGYDLYQSPSQKHEFMRFETWSSEDALETHKKTPHLRASFEKRQREGWTTQIMVFGRVDEERGAR